MKYEYNVRRNQALRTSVSNTEKWVLDFLDELGQNGELVVSITELQEPSTFSASDGTPIPYYVVLVLTAREIADDDTPQSETPDLQVAV